MVIGTAQAQSATAETSVSYRTHVQTFGWQGFAADGKMSGTTGKAKRLEGIEIKISNSEYTGGITYRTHVQTFGWQGFVADGKMSGTVGKAKRLEGIEIKLTGELANHYDVQYRTHVQKDGWQGWKSNGQMSGTEGRALRLEGIEIKLVKKTGSSTTPTTPSEPVTPTIPNNRVEANRLKTKWIADLKKIVDDKWDALPPDTEIDSEGYFIRKSTGFVFTVEKDGLYDYVFLDETGNMVRYASGFGILVTDKVDDPNRQPTF